MTKLLQNKRNICNTVVFFTFSIVSFMLLTRTPLHPWVMSEAATDSSVFKTVSLMMHRGYMPYRDSFDHKGPLIYLINYIGDLLLPYSGVCIIEMVSLTVTLYILFRICRLFARVFPSVIVVGISISYLNQFLEGGNLVEEYALPFISVSIYYFLDYFTNNRISNIRLVIIGCSMGAVVLLRLNMIAVWMVFCIAVLVHNIHVGRVKSILIYLMWFCAGLLLFIVPFLLWMVFNDSIKYFISDYLVFNSQYTAHYSSLYSVLKAAKYFFCEEPIYNITFFAMLYICCKNRNILNISYIVFMITTILMISMAGLIRNHYGMILVPVIAYPFSMLFCDIEKNKNLILNAIMILWAAFVFILPDSIGLMKNLYSVIKEEGYVDDNIRMICGIIDEKVNENEPITVYGNWDIIYVLSNRKHATKYSYQFPIAEVNPEILDEYYEELSIDPPRCVVIQAGRYDERIHDYLIKYDYNKVSFENTPGDDTQVYIKR